MKAQQQLRPSTFARLKHWCSTTWSHRHTKKGHKVLFTLGGTFVLVATFFIHDYLREDAKDLRDKLDSSRTETQIKSLIVQNRLSPSRVKLLSTSYGSDLLSQVVEISDKLALAADIKGEIETKLQIADEFLDALEKKDRLDRGSEIATVSLELDKCNIDQVTEEVAELRKKIANDSITTPDLQKSAGDLRHKLNNSALCVVGAQLAAGTAMMNVEEAADSALKQAERKHRIFTYASLFLVPFGFILAAIGQLTGLGEVKAD